MAMCSTMLKMKPILCVEFLGFFSKNLLKLFKDKMHSHIYHFLALAVLALLVHANYSPPGLRADDKERSKALFGILDNSDSFSPKVEAIIPRIEEWFVQKPFDVDFSTITNSSSVFAKLAEYAVESERGLIPRLSFVYSSNENETTVEFEKGPVKEVKLTLLFRASEHGFLSREFHGLCDGKGPTITLVKAENRRMAAAYNGNSWGDRGFRLNLNGFLALIPEDSGAIGGYSLQKYAANEHAYVRSYPNWGPYFGCGLYITNRCNENENSYSYSILDGYGPGGVEQSSLFGEERFRVLEYEVFRLK
jgi:hypothetical protein